MKIPTLKEYIKNYSFEDMDHLGFHLDVKNYIEFLETPLTMGMFVPIGEKDKILTKPKSYDKWLLKPGRCVGYEDPYEEWVEYKKALQNVIFKGFTYNAEHQELYFKEEYFCYFDEEGLWIDYIDSYQNYNIIEDVIVDLEINENRRKFLGI